LLATFPPRFCNCLCFAYLSDLRLSLFTLERLDGRLEEGLVRGEPGILGYPYGFELC
jgi:hypothetical protein